MPDETVFLYLIFANMAILCMDLITWYTDGRTFPFARFLLIGSNVLYYVLSSIILVLWLMYVTLRLSNKHMKGPILTLAMLPLVFEVFMSITAPWNGLYFYVDAANIYHRGAWCWTQAAIGIAYMLYAAAIALIHAIQAKDLSVRKESLTLVVFTIFPLLCSIVQSQYFGLPLIWIGTTISFMIFFIQNQNSQISIDNLTQINNRGKFDAYLSQQMRDLKKEETLYLVVIDIDKFKAINDNFGHVEGDKALIALADILKKCCTSQKDFSARYGGDEFTLVSTRAKTENIQPLMEKIESSIENYNKKSNKPFDIHISYGIASMKEASAITEEELKRQADERMYEMKAVHHKNV
jgi:diguanylate cyclase (GGDEF)-like protein